jgi:hypothetical protein
MLTDDEIEQQVKALMFDLMLVLYNHNITVVNIGGLMRLLGVDIKIAAQHDTESIALTDEFAKYVIESRNTKRPDNETLH